MGKLPELPELGKALSLEEAYKQLAIYFGTSEEDIEQVMDLATGHDFHYLQSQLIVDYKIPNTNDTIQLIGVEGFFDTT